MDALLLQKAYNGLMVFWRKKKNIAEQEQDDSDQALLHPEGEPDIEPSTDYSCDIADDPVQAELHVKDNDIIDGLDVVPTPDFASELEVVQEEDPDIDHSAEGGWFSRMARGLGKSSSRITRGLADIVTKSKLDQDALDRLEEVLIEADLGPQTAARVIADFSKDRFGKDITEEEIKEALADSITKILEPVAKPLVIEKPAHGPFVVLVCGVNGAGKTTTIGKIYAATAHA